MNTNASDDTRTVGEDGEQNRYAELTIGNDDFVIYDRQNHQAWIQSTVAVTADEMR